jgi:ribosomal protein S6--L-glutamate ligase
MRIAILSSGLGWHVRDLIRAATELGHEATLIDFRHLAAGVETTPVPLEGFDAALVRTVPAGSLEQVIFRLNFIHAAASHGLLVLNPPRAIETCADKYLTSVRLAAAGLPTPPTHAAQRTEEALAAFERLGRNVVLKPVFGSEGRGLQHITDRELAWRTFRVLEQSGQLIYQQQFIPHPGFDLRVLVMGGKVLAAMQRHSGGDWRTNIAQGGTPVKVQLSTRASELATRAAAAVNCSIAGVDLLPSSDGQLFAIEVNAVPGWRALAPTCDLDVAASIVKYLDEVYSQ